MIIDPKGLNSLTTRQGGRTEQSTERKPAAAPKEEPRRSDSVEISQHAQNLQKLEAKIVDAPAVNEDKVAALKAAIADGSYKIDAQKLAENILVSEGL